MRMRRTGGRPRSGATTEAILRAALRVVAERGFQGATLDEIVGVAGSSKPTVYRRWGSKAALLGEAVRFALREAGSEAPRTGDAVHDLRVVLKSMARALSTTELGGAVRAVVGAADGDAELGRVVRAMDASRRQLLHALLAHGQRQSRRLTELDIDRLVGALYFRFLVRRQPIGPAFVDELVDRHFAAR
jgi:AcrR family transcriptional regulator